MSVLPPPPDGPSDDSAPDAFAAIPPPVPGEAHVDDVLERRKKISWKNFGGDGFLVSVAFHVLLAIIAIFYIVSRYKAPEKKTDPDVFATGAGGGANGDKPKAFEQKLQTKQLNVKMPTRITSKSASAISLPDTPQTSTASFAAGLTSGGMSKGSGGGTGGGEGTGIGIGKGGGRNFVSLFGARGANAAGLPGVFYDGKQTSDGKPTKYEPASATAEFAEEVLRTLVRGWDAARLDAKFFKAPERLVASQIFIPRQDASAAPRAYGVGDSVKASRWLVWYHGTVRAPKSGKFRFWGMADDVMYVRFNGRPALDGGYTVLSVKGSPNYHVTTGKPVLGVTESKVALRTTAHVRAGPWIQVQRGEKYPIEVVISELPGGVFCAWLMMEEADESGRGDGKLFLFRMTAEPLPEGMVDDTGLAVDMSGKGLVWKAEGAKATVR